MKLWFLNKTKFFVMLSCAVILAGLVAGFINGGLNLGIDFTGGSILTVDLGESYDVQDVKDALSANGIDPATSQIVSGGDNGTQAIIRIQSLPSGEDSMAVRDGITASLAEKYPNINTGEIESVGGATSRDIVANAFWSVVIAAGLMLIYIWIRFTLFSGIAGVVALLHDVLIMTSLVCIFRMQINSSYIAACLTIVGYSINDTIVVFDRIRGERKKIQRQGNAEGADRRHQHQGNASENDQHGADHADHDPRGLYLSA